MAAAAAAAERSDDEAEDVTPDEVEGNGVISFGEGYIPLSLLLLPFERGGFTSTDSVDGI